MSSTYQGYYELSTCWTTSECTLSGDGRGNMCPNWYVRTCHDPAKCFGCYNMCVKHVLQEKADFVVYFDYIDCYGVVRTWDYIFTLGEAIEYKDQQLCAQTVDITSIVGASDISESKAEQFFDECLATADNDSGEQSSDECIATTAATGNDLEEESSDECNATSETNADLGEESSNECTEIATIASEEECVTIGETKANNDLGEKSSDEEADGEDEKEFDYLAHADDEVISVILTKIREFELPEEFEIQEGNAGELIKDLSDEVTITTQRLANAFDGEDGNGFSPELFGRSSFKTNRMIKDFECGRDENYRPRNMYAFLCVCIFDQITFLSKKSYKRLMQHLCIPKSLGHLVNNASTFTINFSGGITLTLQKIGNGKNAKYSVDY